MKMLLFRFFAFIVHASIFCPHFSQKQKSKPAKQNTGNVLLLNCNAREKILALLKEKKIHQKKSLMSVLHQNKFSKDIFN